MNRTQAWKLVEAARFASLATVGIDGTPHVVPCVFGLAGDTVYTAVDEKPKRTRQLQRLADLADNPAATLLVHEWHEDWTQLWWVQLRGRARVVTDEQEKSEARRRLLNRYPQYGDPLSLDPVLAIDVTTWRAWSATPITESS
jgi:PPOX class probable F420-dependent enzyme